MPSSLRLAGAVCRLKYPVLLRVAFGVDDSIAKLLLWVMILMQMIEQGRDPFKPGLRLKMPKAASMEICTCAGLRARSRKMGRHRTHLLVVVRAFSPLVGLGVQLLSLLLLPSSLALLPLSLRISFPPPLTLMVVVFHQTVIAKSKYTYLVLVLFVLFENVAAANAQNNLRLVLCS